MNAIAIGSSKHALLPSPKSLMGRLNFEVVFWSHLCSYLSLYFVIKKKKSPYFRSTLSCNYTDMSKVMNLVPYRPVLIVIVQIQCPIPLTSFRLQYRSVLMIPISTRQYRTVPANIGRYQTTFKFLFFFSYRTISVGTAQYRTVPNKYRTIFYFYFYF